MKNFVSTSAVSKSYTAMICFFAIVLTGIMFVSIAFFSPEVVMAADGCVKSVLPWWAWTLMLFAVTFILGIVAVLGGVGGGVLFVPVIGAFFPFHIDYVRGAGLFVALAGALAAGPALLKNRLADLRLSLPLAVVASAFAIAGAMIGLALPTNVVQISLGATTFGIVLILLVAKKSGHPEVRQACALSTALRINGLYHEVATGQNISWQVHRIAQGLAASAIIGFLSGMLGLGADWANVPVLNMMMGVPLKVSVATGKFLLSITNTSAAWFYFNDGAALPMVVMPSIIGTMLGSILGVRILSKKRPAAIKYMLIIMLLIAGVMVLLKGLGI